MALRLFTVFLWMFWALAGAQESGTLPVPATQKCVVGGVATDANTSEVLRKMAVHLSTPSGADAEYSTMTDGSGHFRFENLRPGDYTLEGERAGYLKSYFGSRTPRGTGTLVHLDAGNKLSDLQLKLWPRCIVSGKVLDENGQPVSAQISAVSQVWFRGQRRYFARSMSSTDEAGEYRMSELEPGRYSLYASPQSERFVEEQGTPEKGLVPMFYPDSQTLDGATAFEVHPGEDVSGINFRLRMATVFHIRGRADMSASRDREHLQVSAARHGLIADLSELGSEIKRDGAFDIPGVPAGSYDLRICGGGGDYQCSGNLTVDVANEDVSGVVIHLPSFLEVKGTVRGSDADGRSFAGTQIRLLETGAALNEGYYAVVQPDGTFKLRDVSPGTYVMNVFVRGETDYVKSILYGQRDVLGVPIEFSSGAEEVQIIVSKGAGQVEGTVQMVEQQGGRNENAPSAGLQIVLVSERPRRDSGSVLRAKSDQNRHFSFKKVPPGKYYAFAAADVDSEIWENRDFIAQIQESGKEIEVAEGARAQIQVSVLPTSDVDRAMSNLGL